MARVRLTVLLFALVLAAATAVAVPVRKNVISVHQPDGSTLHLVAAGDERLHILHTTDGIAVTKAVDGSYRYVTGIKADGMAAGGMSAHDIGDRGYAEKRVAAGCMTAKEYLEAQEATPGEYSLTKFKAKGERRGLVLLVDFPDKPFTMDSVAISRRIDSQLNQKGYHDEIIYQDTQIIVEGSARDYFEAQSYGLFTPSFHVAGPVRADSSYIHYGKNTGGSDFDGTAWLVAEVCSKAYKRGLFDPKEFDSDGDGVVDFVYLIYAGRGENYAGSDPNTIWPHASSINLNLDGTRIRNYICSCELFYDSEDIIDGIGPFCHEFCHIMGLPDFYDTGTGANFIFDWSIMDNGVYGNYGFSPVGMSALERFSIGWMDIPTLHSPGKYSLDDLGKTSIAYRLPTDDPDKYIILECHDKTGWFKYQEAAGLLATAVSYDRQKWLGNRVNTNSKNPGYTVLPADNNLSSDTQSGDLYPYKSNDSLTLWSNPPASAGGHFAINSITGIRYSEGAASFTIPGATEIQAIPEQGTTVSVTADGMLRINAQATTRITVCSLTGKTELDTYGSLTVALPAGIHLVQYDGRSRKILIP